MQAPPGEVTLLLQRWKMGEESALEDLMPVVYPHLRAVAASFLRRERNADVMQSTALVHELYLRLLHQKKAEWADRAHFYAFAAKIMRMILTDHARATSAKKRGGDGERVPLNDEMPWVSVDSTEFLELNRALEELESLDPEKVRLVELRYFLGCTAEETAELAGVSKATVDRDLKFVRSWLYRKLKPNG